MRMWMVDPVIMCRKHLLGEHVEHHMFIGTINKGVSIKGYVRDNLMEPAALFTRHDELVEEMEKRGYDHKSPLAEHIGVAPEDYGIRVDVDRSLAELVRRCPECRSRAETIVNWHGYYAVSRAIQASEGVTLDPA